MTFPVTGYQTGQQGVTLMDGQFVPQIFVDAVRAGFPGMRALFGTGAARINTNMPYGNDWIGREIVIPYFNLLGELQDIDGAGNVADGGALTPTMLTSFPEKATIHHSGGAVEWTKWAMANPIDPYGEGARQLNVATVRRADKALIDIACANVANEWDKYTVDSTAGTTKVILTYDQIVSGRSVLGDYGLNMRPACMVAHSKVVTDLYNTKDGIGRPLLIQGTDLNINLLAPLNLPVITSDRMPVVAASGSTPAKYKSLLLWPDALVFWMNGTPMFVPWMNPAIPSSQLYIHSFWAAHRYTNLDQMPIPGVTHLVSNAAKG